MKLNYHLLNESVVLNYLGKTVVVAKDDSRFQPVIEAIKSGNLDDIPAIVEIERSFDGSGLELRDGILFDGENAIPSELNARILRHKEEGLPYDSLVKLWENIKQNPSYNSRQQLFNFLQHNGHPITEDGCFIAYRGVTEDFKDMHTKTFDNSVGSVCEMPREQVDDNINNTCSKGLHVACYNYAKGFGPQMVDVKVNPRDVVAVPTDYQGTKMRTCRFEVVAVGEKMHTEAIYGYQAPTEQVEEEDTEDDDPNNDYSCDNCGEEHDAFATFCSSCGERL